MEQEWMRVRIAEVAQLRENIQENRAHIARLESWVRELIEAVRHYAGEDLIDGHVGR